jgi:hypothetical protein
MKIRSMPHNSFHFKSTLKEWEQVRDWMTENNIVWHPVGNKVIMFDNKEHAVMFALRWL